MMLFRALLFVHWMIRRIYPREFRHEYADDMRLMFVENWTSRRTGRLEWLAFELWDSALVGARLRWRDSSSALKAITIILASTMVILACIKILPNLRWAGLGLDPFDESVAKAAIRPELRPERAAPGPPPAKQGGAHLEIRADPTAAGSDQHWVVVTPASGTSDVLLEQTPDGQYISRTEYLAPGDWIILGAAPRGNSPSPVLAILSENATLAALARDQVYVRADKVVARELRAVNGVGTELAAQTPVNLRTGPSEDDEPIAELQLGERCRLRSEVDPDTLPLGWLPVENLEGTPGFVPADHLLPATAMPTFG